jgi:hypothetical protein
MGSFSSDVKAVTKAGDQTVVLGVGRARIRQIQIVTTNSGTGSVVVKDGAGGTTVLTMTLPTAAASVHSINIPADGILCVNDPQLVLGDGITQVTVFHA